MEASLRLGHIRGIPIGIHYTWFIVFGLLTYSLAIGLLPSLYPGWADATYWVTGAIASVLLFASVLAHELGHAFTAQAKGIPVRSITLFIFGGVAAIAEDSEKARDEFAIAIMGPAVSVAIAAVSGALWFAVRGLNEQLAAILLYLALANSLLVVFNMIPGFPLDGGRVFRAILWGVTGNVMTATRIASTVGVVIGYGFIIGGIFLVFSVPITGIWLIAIGWFLQSAADQSYQQLKMRRTFEGIRAQQLMDGNPVVVPPGITIEELVDRYMLGRNLRGLPVVDNDRLVGIITLTDIKDTPRDRWSQYRVADCMTPEHEVLVASPTTELDEVLQIMSEKDVHQIPVVYDGQLVGLLTRGAVIRFLQLRQTLPIEVTKDPNMTPSSQWVRPVR
jgi:Zn-dependent protease/CBS domain-containing protein